MLLQKPDPDRTRPYHKGRHVCPGVLARPQKPLMGRMESSAIDGMAGPMGFVKSFSMESQQERLVPYITCGAMYIWSYVIFRKSGLPEILNVILLGATITLFACFFITIFRKISIHTGAM